MLGVGAGIPIGMPVFLCGVFVCASCVFVCLCAWTAYVCVLYVRAHLHHGIGHAGFVSIRKSKREKREGFVSRDTMHTMLSALSSSLVGALTHVSQHTCKKTYTFTHYII